MSTNQEQIEKQLNEMRSQINEQSNKQSNPPPQQNQNIRNQNINGTKGTGMNSNEVAEDERAEVIGKRRRHRFNVGYNSDLKIKLKPEHTRPLYTQGPPKPINLRHELTVEIALMHYHGLITTLSHSKYSSPLFANRKLSGKMRMLFDLRRINHSLKNINSNFPISNMPILRSTSQERACLPNLIAHKHTTVCKWQMTFQSNLWHLTSVHELTHTNSWLKV